ncbi:MAG: hypothetical protein WBG95_02510 [Sulfitobacter sp.]
MRAHYWPFGDMPMVEGLRRGDVTLITAYKAGNPLAAGRDPDCAGCYSGPDIHTRFADIRFT